ncbi:MAG TPA: YkvA family protein [Burkholderiaceae bacterium]|nr:YkvA family protein [Burkholderiaceae bacterium]
MSISETIRAWAKRIKRDAVMLWFARRHPDTPFLAKALCVFAVAYALSPIDLIPDFIPVLGYVDDALLLPALIWLAVRLLPARVIQECRVQAEEWMVEEKTKPTSYAGAAAIVVIWLTILYLGWWWYSQRS